MDLTKAAPTSTSLCRITARRSPPSSPGSTRSYTCVADGLKRVWRAPAWLCGDGIEDSCNSRADLVALCMRFWDSVADVDPPIRGCSQYPVAWIHALCAHPTACDTLGEFTFKIFYSYSAGITLSRCPHARGWLLRMGKVTRMEDCDSRLAGETRRRP
ncbi:uncharacterized protein SCHCODRAFT_02723361, partial [Schizophyllum commune H4-8]